MAAPSLFGGQSLLDGESFFGGESILGGESVFQVSLPESASKAQQLVQAASFSAPQLTHGKGILTSATVLSDHMEKGVLSADRAEQTWQITMEACKAVSQDIEASQKRIREAIDSFMRTGKEMREELKAFALRKFSEMKEGKEIEEKDLNHLRFYKAVITDFCDLESKAIEQAQRLQELSILGMIGKYQGVLDLMNGERFKEIKALSEMLTAVQQQENHEMEAVIAYQTHRMKEESLEFDRALAVAHVYSAERAQEREMGLKEKAQSNQSEQSRQELALKKYQVFQELALASQKADDHRKLEQKKLDNENAERLYQREIQQKTIQLKYSSESRRLDADERIKLLRIRTDQEAKRIEALRLLQDSERRSAIQRLHPTCAVQ